MIKYTNYPRNQHPSFVNKNKGFVARFLSCSHPILPYLDLCGERFVCLQTRGHPWLRADISNLLINGSIRKARF